MLCESIFDFSTGINVVGELSFFGICVDVHDGDTVKIEFRGKVSIHRLENIDAPEIAQKFGKESRDYLRKLILGKLVLVTTHKTDKYNRELSLIEIAGKSVNKLMVSSGNAWVYKQYCKESGYFDQEKKAKQIKKGLWAESKPIPPWEFRKRKK